MAAKFQNKGTKLRGSKKKERLSVYVIGIILVYPTLLLLIVSNVYFLFTPTEISNDESSSKNNALIVSKYNNNENAAAAAAAAVAAAAAAAAAVKEEVKDEKKEEKRDDGDNGKEVPEIHVIISTGCSTTQDWQSYMFFHSAMKNGQKGHVTRIASGCNAEEARILKKFYEEQIASMAPGRFHLHLTPDYSGVKEGIDYKYFNKPFGVLHWFEHSLGYPVSHNHDNVIVVLCDPDMILLRPFTNDFTNEIEVWRETTTHPYWKEVKHGQPFAQRYGFGQQWFTKTDIKEFSKPEESPSPLLSMRPKERIENFSAGPPYLATGRDFYQVAKKWAEFVPHVHTQYPHPLAEMFAYCLAAAHLKLPHQIATSFMLSDITSGPAEAWEELILSHDEKDSCMNIPKEYLPHTLHYCHRHFLGKYFISKYRLPKDFISCEAPLLKLPPKDIGATTHFGIAPNDNGRSLIGNIKHFKINEVKMTAFMLCSMIYSLNDAARYYKENHCPEDGTTNFEESYTFHIDMTIDPSIK